MKLFTNVYSQAQTWMDAMKARQAKQQAFLEPAEETENVTTVTPILRETVFTQEDRGHSEEEAQKIQQIYTKLKGFGFAASYVGY